LIRRANKSDIEDINRLGNLLHNNFNKLFHIETEVNSSLAIVLVSDNYNINGYLYALEFVDRIDLLSIVVDPNNRAKGIGSKLMEELIKISNGRDIILEVDEENIEALGLYRKYGFMKVGEREKYYKDKNAIVMKRGNE